MRANRLKDLARKASDCRRCSALEQRSAVLGHGNGPPWAKVMFVAEAPGRLGADRTGVPLHGDRTGMAFEKLLAETGWQRDEVFITNVVLCNPREAQGRNRRPSLSEISTCSGWLREQIMVVNPELIVTLGAVALAALKQIEEHSFIQAKDVGIPHRWFGRTLVPLYHPSPRAWRWRSLRCQEADFRALTGLLRECSS